MAKQKTSSLLQASAALAESKSSTPVLTAVGEGFGKAIKMVEEEQQRIQDTVNDHMGDLKTDIDFTTLDPAMEKQVRNYLLDGKQEYSKMANELAKIKDASDPRYQELVDGMNEIQQGYSTLAGELTSYNQNKITTADQVRSGLFSKGTDQLGRITSVYGLDGTKPTVRIDKGHLNFTIGGENIEYAKMKALPGVATKAAATILDAQVEFSKRGTPITPQEKSRYARIIEDTLRDQNTLASILSDYPDELPLADLQDKFFTLRKDGKLDAAALTDIRREVKDRILKGYEEASSIGVKAYEDKIRATGDGNDGNSGNKMSDIIKQMQIVQDYYNLGTGVGAIDLTADDLKFVLGGATNPVSVVYKPDNKDAPWEVTRKTLDENGMLSAEVIKYRSIEDILSRTTILN